MSDPCECFFNQEAAVQRLLAILRNSQSLCTDSECLPDGLAGGSGDQTIMLWTLLWTVLAMGLYFMRPNSMRSGAERQRNNEEAILEKPTSSSNDQPPPPPPPSAM
ncbi:unnamed protein product [Caenorhabditis angaria]|uniref:Small integral membrane protein 14 n=1 Tax=Caenorhabditis angaria TaxID=860376 RepID=A0A9P1N1B4_9PELO|nr:unnamed protein product [Caenorhabditis angaria]